MSDRNSCTISAKNEVKTNTALLFYFIAVGLFIVLKFAYRIADNNDLIFLLKPTDKLVGLLTGSHSIYIPSTGFYYERLDIVIDKSCSGFNFWLLCFLLFTYVLVNHAEKITQKIAAIPVALLGAYLLTITVNTCRIFASIVIQQQTKNIFPNHQHLIHESIGIITNLTFLVLTYILIEKFLNHIKTPCETYETLNGSSL